MPLHDYHCLTCGAVRIDVAIPIAIGATAGAPDCPDCEFPAPMAWIPAARFSGFNDSGDMGASSFAKFTTQVEDPGSPTGYRDITIGSLSDIRREERESEQRARNGEGQQLIWRDYSQSASNRDKHTMMDDPSLKAPKFYSNGTRVKVRRGAPVIADHGTVEQAQAAEGSVDA